MGIATILQAKNIIVVANVKDKSSAVKALIHGSINEE